MTPSLRQLPRHTTSLSPEAESNGERPQSAPEEVISQDNVPQGSQNAAPANQGTTRTVQTPSILTRPTETQSPTRHDPTQNFRWDHSNLFRATHQFRRELLEVESWNDEQVVTATRSLEFLTRFRDRLSQNLSDNPEVRFRQLSALLFCDRSARAFRQRHRAILGESSRAFEEQNQNILNRIQEAKGQLRDLRGQLVDQARDESLPLRQRLQSIRLAHRIDEKLNLREERVQDLDLWQQLVEQAGSNDLPATQRFDDLGRILAGWHQLRQLRYDQRSLAIQAPDEISWEDIGIGSGGMGLGFINPALPVIGLGYLAYRSYQVNFGEENSDEAPPSSTHLSLSEGEITERMRNVRYAIENTLPELHSEAIPEIEQGLDQLINSDAGEAAAEFEGVLNHLNGRSLQSLIERPQIQQQALLALRTTLQGSIESGQLSSTIIEQPAATVSLNGASPQRLSELVSIEAGQLQYEDSYQNLSLENKAHVLNALIRLGMGSQLQQAAEGSAPDSPTRHFHLARQALAEGNLDRGRLELVSFLRATENSEDEDVGTLRNQARMMNLALQQQALERMGGLENTLFLQRNENLGNFSSRRNHERREGLIREIGNLLQDESQNIYTLEDALAHQPRYLATRSAQATREFRQNPEIGPGLGITVNLEMFGSQGVPADFRRVPQIREEFRENPEGEVAGMPTVTLNGGTLVYRSEHRVEEMTHNHHPFLRVRVGPAGGVINHCYRFYTFPPSTEERWVLLGLNDVDYVGPGELPRSNRSEVAASGAPTIYTPTRVGHPSYYREILHLFNDEGALGDEQLQAFLNVEGEAALRARVENPSAQRTQQLQLAQALRARNGSYAVAGEILEGLMEPELQRIRQSLSPSDLRQIETQVENSREEITQGIHRQVVSSRPRPSQRQVNQMIESAVDLQRVTLLRRLELRTLRDRYDNGQISDPLVRQAWEEFNDMEDPLDEWFNLADASLDRIVDQVVQEAFLLVLTMGAGAVASLAESGTRLVATQVARSWLARGGVNAFAGRAAVWAETGGARALMGRTTLRLLGTAAQQSGYQVAARMGVWSVGKIANGSAFALTMMGLRTAFLGERGLFDNPLHVAQEMGMSIIMMGALGAGNSLWGRASQHWRLSPDQVQRMAGIGSREAALRRGAHFTGQLATELNMLTAVGHANAVIFNTHGPEGNLLDQYAHNLRTIVGLRMGHRLMTHMTGGRLENLQRNLEERIHREQNEALRPLHEERIANHRQEIDAILRDLTGEDPYRSSDATALVVGPGRRATGKIPQPNSSQYRFLRWVLEQNVAQNGNTDIAEYLRSPEGLQAITEAAQALQIGEANPGTGRGGLILGNAANRATESHPSERATQLILSNLIANATVGARSPQEVARRLRDYRRHLTNIAEPLRQLAAEVESGYFELLQSLNIQPSEEMYHLFHAQFASHALNEGMTREQVRDLLRDVRAGEQRFEISFDPESGDFQFGFRRPGEVTAEEIPLVETPNEETGRVEIVDEVPADAIDATPRSVRERAAPRSNEGNGREELRPRQLESDSIVPQHEPSDLEAPLAPVIDITPHIQRNSPSPLRNIARSAAAMVGISTGLTLLDPTFAHAATDVVSTASTGGWTAGMLAYAASLGALAMAHWNGGEGLSQGGLNQDVYRQTQEAVRTAMIQAAGQHIFRNSPSSPVENQLQINLIIDVATGQLVASPPAADTPPESLFYLRLHVNPDRGRIELTPSEISQLEGLLEREGLSAEQRTVVQAVLDLNGSPLAASEARQLRRAGNYREPAYELVEPPSPESIARWETTFNTLTENGLAGIGMTVGWPSVEEALSVHILPLSLRLVGLSLDEMGNLLGLEMSQLPQYSPRGTTYRSGIPLAQGGNRVPALMTTEGVLVDILSNDGLNPQQMQVLRAVLEDGRRAERRNQILEELPYLLDVILGTPTGISLQSLADALGSTLNIFPESYRDTTLRRGQAALLPNFRWVTFDPPNSPQPEDAIATIAFTETVNKLRPIGFEYQTTSGNLPNRVLEVLEWVAEEYRQGLTSGFLSFLPPIPTPGSNGGNSGNAGGSGTTPLATLLALGTGAATLLGAELAHAATDVITTAGPALHHTVLGSSGLTAGLVTGALSLGALAMAQMSGSNGNENQAGLSQNNDTNSEAFESILSQLTEISTQIPQVQGLLSLTPQSVSEAVMRLRSITPVSDSVSTSSLPEVLQELHRSIRNFQGTTDQITTLSENFRAIAFHSLRIPTEAMSDFFRTAETDPETAFLQIFPRAFPQLADVFDDIPDRPPLNPEELQRIIEILEIYSSLRQEGQEQQVHAILQTLSHLREALPSDHPERHLVENLIRTMQGISEELPLFDPRPLALSLVASPLISAPILLASGNEMGSAGHVALAGGLSLFNYAAVNSALLIRNINRYGAPLALHQLYDNLAYFRQLATHPRLLLQVLQRPANFDGHFADVDFVTRQRINAILSNFVEASNDTEGPGGAGSALTTLLGIGTGLATLLSAEVAHAATDLVQTASAHGGTAALLAAGTALFSLGMATTIGGGSGNNGEGDPPSPGGPYGDQFQQLIEEYQREPQMQRLVQDIWDLTRQYHSQASEAQREILDDQVFTVLMGLESSFLDGAYLSLLNENLPGDFVDHYLVAGLINGEEAAAFLATLQEEAVQPEALNDPYLEGLYSNLLNRYRWETLRQEGLGVLLAAHMEQNHTTNPQEASGVYREGVYVSSNTPERVRLIPLNDVDPGFSPDPEPGRYFAYPVGIGETGLEGIFAVHFQLYSDIGEALGFHSPEQEMEIYLTEEQVQEMNLRNGSFDPSIRSGQHLFLLTDLRTHQAQEPSLRRFVQQLVSQRDSLNSPLNGEWALLDRLAQLSLSFRTPHRELPLEDQLLLLRRTIQEEVDPEVRPFLFARMARELIRMGELIHAQEILMEEELFQPEINPNNFNTGYAEGDQSRNLMVEILVGEGIFSGPLDPMEHLLRMRDPFWREEAWNSFLSHLELSGDSDLARDILVRIASCPPTPELPEELRSRIIRWLREIIPTPEDPEDPNAPPGGSGGSTGGGPSGWLMSFAGLGFGLANLLDPGLAHAATDVVAQASSHGTTAGLISAAVGLGALAMAHLGGSNGNGKGEGPYREPGVPSESLSGIQERIDQIRRQIPQVSQWQELAPHTEGLQEIHQAIRNFQGSTEQWVELSQAFRPIAFHTLLVPFESASDASEGESPPELWTRTEDREGRVTSVNPDWIDENMRPNPRLNLLYEETAHRERIHPEVIQQFQRTLEIWFGTMRGIQEEQIHETLRTLSHIRDVLPETHSERRQVERMIRQIQGISEEWTLFDSRAAAGTLLATFAEALPIAPLLAGLGTGPAAGIVAGLALLNFTATQAIPLIRDIRRYGAPLALNNLMSHLRYFQSLVSQPRQWPMILRGIPTYLLESFGHLGEEALERFIRAFDAEQFAQDFLHLFSTDSETQDSSSPTPPRVRVRVAPEIETETETDSEVEAEEVSIEAAESTPRRKKNSGGSNGGALLALVATGTALSTFFNADTAHALAEPISEAAHWAMDGSLTGLVTAAGVLGMGVLGTIFFPRPGEDPNGQTQMSFNPETHSPVEGPLRDYVIQVGRDGMPPVHQHILDILMENGNPDIRTLSQRVSSRIGHNGLLPEIRTLENLGLIQTQSQPGTLSNIHSTFEITDLGEQFHRIFNNFTLSMMVRSLGRHILFVLREPHYMGQTRLFSELGEQDSDTLNHTLRLLESRGILTIHPNHAYPERTRYRLTDDGQRLAAQLQTQLNQLQRILSE